MLSVNEKEPVKTGTPGYKEFPKWMYGPNGESQIFNSEVEILEGWQDHPSKVEGFKEAVSETQEELQEEVVKGIDPSDEAITQEAIKANLEKTAMPKLWKMCKDLGISKEGKKNEVVDRIFATLEERAPKVISE